MLIGICSMVGRQATIGEKTLVVWAAPANLTDRGGSALTLEGDGGTFDGVVFGEITPGKWMAGSDNFSRTLRDQSAYRAEARPGVTTQIAIVYRGKTVTLYRNGQEVSSYAVPMSQRFSVESSAVLIGRRHTAAAPRARDFIGTVDEARIYDRALTAGQVASLKRHVADLPAPYAWWDFADGRVSDKTGRFPATTVFGGARVVGGKLHLDREGDYLMAETAHADLTPAETNRAFREKLLHDRYRPGYHFVIPEGVAMPFDPNGAIYWKGQYHLFYIYQDHLGHNWGHVSSTDLFHWRNHPTGFQVGMFSGNCFVNKDGVPTLCYHQVDQGNAMAVALDDNLDTWSKLKTNPITPKLKPGDPAEGKYRSWDPYGWVEGGDYYAIFGGEHPAVVKSKTLGGPWSYVGDLMANTVPGVSINEDVSCADFFELGGKRVLLCISHRLGARYYVGDWDGKQFHPEVHERMSWNDNSFFAPESLIDDKGRRIMWSWIFDKPSFGVRGDAGWSGTMSLPRVLTLGPDSRLRMDVPKEIERLRYNPVDFGRRVVDGQDVTLDKVKGGSLEVIVTTKAPSHGRVGLKVCCDDGMETTPVYYDADTKKLVVDASHSSEAGSDTGLEAGPLDLKPGEDLTLRVFVDKSVVEVFANGLQAVMRRVYPSADNPLGVRLFATGKAEFSSVKAWQMMPSNPY